MPYLIRIDNCSSSEEILKHLLNEKPIVRLLLIVIKLTIIIVIETKINVMLIHIVDYETLINAYFKGHNLIYIIFLYLLNM